jgi:hypoxanthine-DNA glycosylase
VSPSNILRSFKPFIDRRSRVLILGSMPGPDALRKQQYYGFDGNHFWKIMPVLFGEEPKESYDEKLQMLKRNGVALWDVIHSCTRTGAMDSKIRDVDVNKIPELIKKYPNIRAVFVNGRFAFNLFLKSFEGKIDRPVAYLPSTSPAHAALPLLKKIERWSVIKKYV